MAKLLFRLRNVPDDEAEAVRALLKAQGFETYETTSGLFQISMPAIWLVHDEDFLLARGLIEQWQHERLHQARAEARAHPALGFWQRFQQAPVKVFLLCLAIVLVAGLTTWPFWRFFLQST